MRLQLRMRRRHTAERRKVRDDDVLEKMATPPEAELSQKNQPKHVDSADTVWENSGSLPKDVPGLREHVVEFLLNKASDDLKSYKNISDVLESLKEENDVLSEQVNH